MVGAVIGHEVSHAFDDQGGQYDEMGNLNDWWDAETEEKFIEKTRLGNDFQILNLKNLHNFSDAL